MRIRRWGVSVAAAATVAACCLVAPAPISAQTAQPLSPGQQVTFSNPPGVALAAPTDGRLNTYGAQSQVVGVAITQQAGTGSEAVTAAPGAELVVLHFKATFPTALSNDLVSSYDQTAFQVTLSSGNVTASLPSQDNTFGGGVDDTLAVAIPRGGPAVLTVSMGGLLPQSFDLIAGKRIGTSPAALYRDPVNAETIVMPTAVQSFTATTSDGQQATGQFDLKVAALSYWQPESTQLAPAPDQAYLGLYFDYTSLKLSDGTDLYPNTLPGSAVQVVLPDGQTLQTTYIAPPYTDDLLDGIYYAPVPADITSAKIVVNPGGPVQAGTPDNATVTLNIPAPLTTQVNFPPPWTPPGQTFSIAPHPPAAHQAKKGGGFAWIVLVILLAVVAAGIFVFMRLRRSWLPPRPVRWPPALPPATTALLMRAPPLALMPGAAERFASDTPPALAAGPQLRPDRPVVVIRLLGALEIEGLRATIRGRPPRRILVCLAVTPERPLSAEELARGISDHPDRDPKVESLFSYVSGLRRSLPEDLLPDAGVAGGYRFDPSRVVVDWHAVAAVTAEAEDSPGWSGRACAALELVRGVPLAGGIWEGIGPAVRLMEAAIEQLAKRLSARLIADGDLAGAEWAVAKALLAVPKSVGLWESRLEAAAAGSGYGLERAWSDSRDELGTDSALLFPRYQQLRRSLGEQPATSA